MNLGEDELQRLCDSGFDPRSLLSCEDGNELRRGVVNRIASRCYATTCMMSIGAPCLDWVKIGETDRSPVNSSCATTSYDSYCVGSDWLLGREANNSPNHF